MDKTYAGIGSQLGGIASGQAGYLNQTEQPPQPALNSLYDALKQMSEAVLMTRNIADRLCGTQPEAITKDGAETSQSYFGQLDDIAAALKSQAGRIISDVRRIENRL